MISLLASAIHTRGTVLCSYRLYASAVAVLPVYNSSKYVPSSLIVPGVVLFTLNWITNDAVHDTLCRIVHLHYLYQPILDLLPGSNT